MGKQMGQSGFGAVEASLVLVAFCIVGFTGWYVYHAKQVADKTLAGTSSTVPTFTRNTGAKQSKTTAKRSTSTALAACTNADITVTQGRKTGAAGTFGVGLVFTNTSGTACTLEGYPATALLDGGGQQIGQAAQPNSTVQAAAVTLQPHAAGYLTVLFPNPGNFSGNQCSTQQSSFVQIKPSGQSSVFKVPLTADQYCPGFSVEAFSSTPD